VRCVLRMIGFFCAALFMSTGLASQTSADDCYALQDGKHCACKTPKGAFVVYLKVDAEKSEWQMGFTKDMIEQQIKKGLAKKAKDCGAGGKPVFKTD
jgi:hypothetical protein